MIDSKEKRVYREYVNYLLDSVDEDTFEAIRIILETKFDAQRLSDMRLAASGIVSMRDDMDTRMREYRNNNPDKFKEAT
jgi:hypothetical protein